MPDLALDEALDVPFTFTARPTPLPCELRPVWRMHILVLILDQCWAGKASLEQLHVLNWAIRTEESRDAFLLFLQGKRAPNQVIVRYDPSVNRAVHFAFAEGLIVHKDEQLELLEDEEPPAATYRIILSDRGRKLVQQIKATDDCFTSEREFLDAIGRKVTQKQVEALFTWRS